MSHTSPLAPSLLSADFSCLMDQLNTLSEAGVTRLHVDVMDGHFVPNLSFGAPVLAKLPQDGRFFYDVHLMVEGPALTIDPYVKAGAGALTFHVEAVDDPLPFIREIKAAGCQAGLSLRPGTAVERLFPYLDSLDLVLVMTVEPGFGGQSFREDQLEKIKQLKNKVIEENLSCYISVDGGITKETAPLCAAAGADIFVAGTAVFKGDITENIRQFEIATGHYDTPTS